MLIIFLLLTSVIMYSSVIRLYVCLDSMSHFSWMVKLTIEGNGAYGHLMNYCWRAPMPIFFLCITRSGEISYLVSWLFLTTMSIWKFNLLYFKVSSNDKSVFNVPSSLMQLDQHFTIMLLLCSWSLELHYLVVGLLHLELALDFGNYIQLNL